MHLFKSILIVIFTLLISAGNLSFASIYHIQKVIWTAAFSNFTPVKQNITEAYCKSHTPSVIVTTIKQITSKKGIDGLNGVNIRYLSYKTVKKDNLYFNIVNAIVRGKDANGKQWSEPMKLYEQTLSSTAVTYTVWSTPNCKGTFLGTPTVIE